MVLCFYDFDNAELQSLTSSEIHPHCVALHPRLSVWYILFVLNMTESSIWKPVPLSRHTSVVQAISLTEEIIHSPTLQRTFDARLPALLSDLRSRLSHSNPTVSFNLIRDLLQEANTLSADDALLSVRLVELSILSLDEFSFDNGALLLEEVVREKLEFVTERLIGAHLESVAVGNFAWLRDLQMAGYSTLEIVDLVKIAETAGPWLTDSGPHPEGEHPGELDADLHQPNCAHTGGARIDQLQHLGVRTKVDWQQLTCDRNELRRRVAAYCGLGGVIPDWKTGEVLSGKTVFDSTRAGVSVFVPEIIEGRGDSTRMLLAGKFDEKTNDRLVEISTSQINVIRFLQRAATRFCIAATVIQKSRSCCSSFTLIVNRKATMHLPAVLDMVSISFQSLKAFRDSLLALAIQPGVDSNFVREMDLQKCSAIGERLLGTFGYTILSSEGIRGLIQYSPLKGHLQVLSLATQLLGFGLMFYTQGHLGPLSPFFLAVPLTEMLLLGVGNDSLYIKASLRNLACLGEMLGGPVFAFELMSANKLSPDVFQLDLTRAVSSENVELISSIMSITPPLPDGGYDLVARAVDIGDSWGPALFISEPEAAYGRKLYAVEIGGGVVAPTDSQSKEVNTSSPAPSVPELEVAYPRRLHDIALEISNSVFTPIPKGEVKDPESIILGQGISDLIGSESEEHGPNIVQTSGDDLQRVYSGSQEDSLNRNVLDREGTKISELRSTEDHLNMPLFHWNPHYDSYKSLKTQSTFSCWDWLQIGSISTNLGCPLSANMYRKQSQQRLSNLGTDTDSWELSERQTAFQAGYYAVFQVGNTYARKLGKTVKQQIIEQWAMFPNIHTLDVLWGLQLSLCTGIARRVSLLHLIEDSLLIHVNPLKHGQWHKILPKARAAFQGSINIDHWLDELDSGQKICLIDIITHALDLLRQTGINHDGSSLSILWPHPLNLSYGIKIPCDKTTYWARMLQDTESCATFAAVTSFCFEGHNQRCRNMKAPPWLENPGFLSTAVCRDVTVVHIGPKRLHPWRLEEGKRYWIGKAGGDCWVLVRKNSKGELQLFVKENHFPKAVSHKIWKLDVLRERPDASFDAEEVIVL